MTQGLGELLGTDSLFTEGGRVDAGMARAADAERALWERWAIEAAPAWDTEADAPQR